MICQTKMNVTEIPNTRRQSDLKERIIILRNGLRKRTDLRNTDTTTNTDTDTDTNTTIDIFFYFENLYFKK